jgi:hypothetical protein
MFDYCYHSVNVISFSLSKSDQIKQILVFINRIFFTQMTPNVEGLMKLHLHRLELLTLGLLTLESNKMVIGRTDVEQFW